MRGRHDQRTRPADDVQAAPRPRAWRAARASALACCALLLSGCLFMPSRGTPVFVDSRSGSYWSGKGLLLEVSEDQTRCLVAARDRALIVHERWVRCSSVHTRVD